MSAGSRGDVWVIIAALLTGLFGFWAGSSLFGPAIDEGSDAPAFTLPEIGTERSVSLADFRGKSVLINFWASWCGPCIEEMPLLDELQASRSDLVVIGIAEDDPEAAREFLEQHPVDYLVLQAAGSVEVSLQWGNERAVLPYSVFVDPEGRVVRAKMGSFTQASLSEFVRP